MAGLFKFVASWLSPAAAAPAVAVPKPALEADEALIVEHAVYRRNFTSEELSLLTMAPGVLAIPVISRQSEVNRATRALAQGGQTITTLQQRIPAARAELALAQAADWKQKADNPLDNDPALKNAFDRLDACVKALNDTASLRYGQLQNARASGIADSALVQTLAQSYTVIGDFKTLIGDAQSAVEYCKEELLKRAQSFRAGEAAARKATADCDMMRAKMRSLEQDLKEQREMFGDPAIIRQHLDIASLPLPNAITSGPGPAADPRTARAPPPATAAPSKKRSRADGLPQPKRAKRGCRCDSLCKRKNCSCKAAGKACTVDCTICRGGANCENPHTNPGTGAGAGAGAGASDESNNTNDDAAADDDDDGDENERLLLRMFALLFHEVNPFRIERIVILRCRLSWWPLSSQSMGFIY